MSNFAAFMMIVFLFLTIVFALSSNAERNKKKKDKYALSGFICLFVSLLMAFCISIY